MERCDGCYPDLGLDLVVSATNSALSPVLLIVPQRALLLVMLRPDGMR
jgi:hypothetical protein